MENQNHEGNLIIDRRSKIIEMLERNGQVKIKELSDLFSVSEVTIRNDLEKLEDKKLLIRSRGGALKSQKVGIDYPLHEKRQKYFKEKQAIGKVAASLIRDGETIILDSGTTTVEIAKNIHDSESLTVITNALNIAGQLLNYSHINVIIPGGILRKNSLSLIGSQAESAFRNFFCDKLFLGVDGIDARYGISTPNIEEAHLNRVMISIAKEVIVVADSSKFLKRSFAFISSMDKITTVVTDSNIPKDEHKVLVNMGINVIIVD